MKTFGNSSVAQTFATYPPQICRKLLALRKLIFDIAKTTDGVGPIEETLKWGELAYMTARSKSGSTIRLGWKKSNPTQYAMYFNCQTNLIESFRTLFPNDFKFEGNRAIVFDDDEGVPVDALCFCIAAALSYHLRK
jgi:Domain of unknown function (DU1801)